MTAIDRTSATLECTLVAHPRACVIWYKNRRILRPNISSKQLFIGDKATLQFKNLFIDDAGIYECVARNILGEARSSCRLTVKGKIMLCLKMCKIN